jgi:hypothetical protein
LPFQVSVPELSRYFGIVIVMYYNEHSPSHFHATHGDLRATVEIESGQVHGAFPPTAVKLVREWLSLHRAELRHNWDLAKARRPLVRIAPLE